MATNDLESREHNLPEPKTNSGTTTTLTSLPTPTKPRKPCSDTFKPPCLVLSPTHDDSGYCEPLTAFENSFWTFETTTGRTAAVKKSIMARLKANFQYAREYFDEAVKMYLREQFLRSFAKSHSENYPFTISPTFYMLCKEICNVENELFADALNESGVLQSFCSANPSDKAFGSRGRWEDVNESVVGGAGVPPFERDFCRRVIKSFESGVRTEKPYCRIVILPLEKNGELEKVKDTQAFAGEILVEIPPNELPLRHQKEFFQIDDDKSYLSWRPACPMALVVWINEAYRVRKPPPIDVEECVVVWTLQALGSDKFVDYDAICRAFPDRVRSGVSKADFLEALFSSDTGSSLGTC